MPIGLFVDGSFVYKTYPDAIDYLKLREVIEADTGDRIDEGKKRGTGYFSDGVAARPRPPAVVLPLHLAIDLSAPNR